MKEPLHDFEGKEISADDEKELWSFRRRMLRAKIHRSICSVGGRTFEIQVGIIGFTIVKCNGICNPHLRRAS